MEPTEGPRYILAVQHRASSRPQALVGFWEQAEPHGRRTSLGSAGGLAFLEESNPRGKGQSRGYLRAGKRVSFPVNFVSVTEFSSQPLNW